MNIEKTVGWKALIFKDQGFQTVDKTLLVSTPEAFFLFWVQKVCT